MIHADVEDPVGDEVPGKFKLIFSNVSEDYFLNWLKELSIAVSLFCSTSCFVFEKLLATAMSAIFLRSGFLIGGHF